MSDLFEDKSAMPGNANIQMAQPLMSYPIGVALKPDSGVPVHNGKPVRVSQTLNERYADRADDAMSVRNLSRPRKGHGY